MFLHSILFVTGAAVLSLELLASRIMTPYFGVSLYIWTGILSITLIALALGYWLGGRLAGARPPRLERLVELYALMPAVAALGIVAACLAYPHLFGALAAADLVAGAFAACLILLLVPLAAASAMNPLLVAIALTRGSRAGGDAGAGMVFSISTAGSVAGVLATAFLLIPHVSNFSGVLTVALVLALSSLAVLARPPVAVARRGRAAAFSVAAVLASGVLLWQADAYTGRMWPARHAGADWRVEATFRSFFGTVKILRTESDPVTGRFVRMYFHDGLVQNRVRSDGVSLSFYTWALESLVLAYAPRPRSVLVLGLGAGVVPMRLAGRGIAVEVVEIDPASLAAARRVFGYRPERAPVHLADARTYLRGCDAGHDVVVVDLFHGDGTPDYLVTRDFFRDLRRCLALGGVAVFNTFADLERPAAYADLLATLRAELPYIVLYRPRWAGAAQVNGFLVAALAPLPDPQWMRLDDVPEAHVPALSGMLEHPRPLSRELLAEGEVVTDARSVATYDIAASQIAFRRAVVEGMPKAFLLN
ncbi:MAG: fused MFS/spermidine synthase [Burkholderiales bacterium]|nr:fused MFS/spermidine synthase [Burkholderiales bacterium]